MENVRGRHLLLDDDDEDNDVILCAICKRRMTNHDFISHNSEMHNMLSWVEGTPPLDMSNEKFILSLLNKALKSRKKKVLCCEICGEEKKSAVGFYTHKQMCGKSDAEKEQLRITCEVCGKSVMPVSLKSHMQIHQRRAAEEYENSIESPVSSSHSHSATPSTSSGRKNKRAAATRAKSRMSMFLSDDGHIPPAEPDKPNQLYAEYDELGWDSTPRLLQTWRGFLSLTGSITCVFNGCSFRCDNIDTIRNHIATCEFSRCHEMRYICCICLFQRRDESEIAAHIQAEHEFKDSYASSDANSCSDRDSASDVELGNPRTPVRRQNRQTSRPKPPPPQRSFNKMRFLQNTSAGVGKDLDIFSAALNWTYEFRSLNYSESLFSTLKPIKEEWKVINDEVETYIPSTSKSIPIEFKSPLQEAPIPPYKFSRFEGQIIDGASIFFTGGPVWAMDWCPVPMRVCLSEGYTPPEYLAVSTHHNMDDTFCVPKCYSFPNIIQIWDCGNLSSQDLYQKPKMVLALAHNYGTVWSLAWCPSGAYETDVKIVSNDETQLRRMGLLAAACSSGNVEIFTIPFPDQLTDHENQKILPVYQTRPSLSLITNFTEPSQCTRVAWYQGQGHSLVAAGYCNGMVALWDLVTQAPLLWDSQHQTLKPFQCFQAHLTVISALSFNPEYDGRFFMTGSHDRGIKFWDLEDLSSPMTHHRRGYVTDGVWVNLWISSVTSYDDAFQHEHTNSTLHPARDFGYKPYPLLTQNSVAWCLSYNDWINATAQGSEAGEIVVTFSGQLMRGLDNEKNAIDKRMMASYTLLKKAVSSGSGEKQLGEVVTWKAEPKKAAKSKGKKPAKNTKGKSKRIAEEEEGENEIAASLYTPDAVLVERNPQFYADIEKSYGICVYDTLKADTNRNKLPEEAKTRVRISGKMHPTCSDFYPITSINKVAWNPNIGRFFWLATGHQCGIVRLISMHFMQTATTNKFLENTIESFQSQ